MSRRSKAITLAPLALLSGMWTASLLSSTATADDTAAAATSLPDGTTIPAEAIEAPASVPAPGVIAPAVPEGAADSVVSSASSNGIPAAALSAYQRGAQIIGSADAACNLPWELLAAVGRVESDHGRYGGNTLSEEGVSTPGIYGIALDGSNGTAAINDTDGGLLDQDTVWDRAVGPMQFIPSTWQVVKVDANGDGERNPQDINDAALAAAVYLCSGDEDLSTRAGQEGALLRYNRSQDYVNLVLRVMEAYSSGDFTAVPSGTQAGTTFTPSFSSTIERTYTARDQRETRERRQQQRREVAQRAPGTETAPAPAAPSGGTDDVTDTVPDTGDDQSPIKKPGAGSTPSAPSVGGAVGSVTDGVDQATGGATEPITKPVVKVITEAEARVLCLRKGIGALDLRALNACIATTKTG